MNDDHIQLEAEEGVVYATPDEPELIAVTVEELITSSYEAIKSVMASALAQIIASDALTASRLYHKINEDVDNERRRYIQIKREAERLLEEE